MKNVVESSINTFHVEDKSTLYCISSRAPASHDIEKDVLNAEPLGSKAKEQFIKDRLESSRQWRMEPRLHVLKLGWEE